MFLIVAEDNPTKIVLKGEVAIGWLGTNLELHITEELHITQQCLLSLHYFTSNVVEGPCVCVCVCVCVCRGMKREEIEIQKQNEKVFYPCPRVMDFLLIAQLEEEILVQ